LIDTPYPGANNDYENPSLAYSTDNGVSWQEWPGLTNPIDPFPGGADYNSDPCMALRNDGTTLRCVYRPNEGGVSYIKYRDVTGTNLTDGVAVGDEATATFPDAVLPRAPSIIRMSDALWYCFGEDDTTTSSGQWLRWKSVDEGANWTDKTAIIPVGGENTKAWWHGAVVGPFGGWYYATFIECALGQRPGDGPLGGDIRLFRSRDLTTWQADPQMFVARGGSPPAWAAVTLYQACLYQTSSGGLAILFSAYKTAGGNVFKVGRQTVPSVEGQAITSAVAFGGGFTTAAETIPTEQGYWEFEEATSAAAALVDLTANANALTVASGAPTWTSGTGFVYDGTDDRHTTGFKMSSLGNDWSIELDMTFPATLTGDAPRHVGDVGAGPVQALRIGMTNTGADIGKLRVVVVNADGAAYDTNNIGSDVRGSRIQLRVDYVSSSRVLRVFINGVRIYNNTNITINKTAIDTSATLCFGGLDAIAYGSQFGACTIHRAQVWASVPRVYADYAPTSVWTLGREEAPVAAWNRD
ncbi:MAG TPA: hypothetical protein VNA25_22775, partial [Phycisphaerae bacterium]|nr:hypothetical protein [Phycisphaerae bacterium]